MKDSRTCLIMLGKLGDVINVLPIAKRYAEHTKAPCPFMTCLQYADILEGCSYVEPVIYDNKDYFNGLGDALKLAGSKFNRVMNLQTGGKGLTFTRRCASFCEEPFRVAGLDGRRGSLPLVFDKRSVEREEKLLERHDLKRPIIIHSLFGKASPLPEFPYVLSAMQQVGNATPVNFIDTNLAGAVRFYDLLALYEKAACLITVDTATLHLAAAIPGLAIIALVNDRPDKWHATRPLGNVVMTVPYSQVIKETDNIRAMAAKLVEDDRRRIWVNPTQKAASDAPKQEPPCIIMLGGAGDILNTLPIARHFSQQCGTPTPFITAERHFPLLEGVTYAKQVGYKQFKTDHYGAAVTWASQNYKKFFPMNLGEETILKSPKTSSFCYEPYAIAGVPLVLRDSARLVINRRNAEREAALRQRVSNKLPLFVYNLTGITSPLPCADALERYLKAHFAGQLNLVNASSLKLTHYFDLLALLDDAVGLLTVDTATLHLAPASKVPYIALVNDMKNPWWCAIPKGNCTLRIGYKSTKYAFDMIASEMSRMLWNRNQFPDHIAPKVKLVTIAYGAAAPVWDVAKVTWERYAKHFGYELVVYNHLHDPALSPSWNKCFAILNELERDPQCVVWWIDCDTIALGLTQPLETGANFDLMVSTDHNGMCFGFFRAANTPWTRSFLKLLPMLGDVRDSDKYGRGHGIKWEQNAVKALHSEFPSIAAKIGSLPRSLVFEFTGRGTAPDPSCLFAHYGGRDMRVRVAQIKEDLPAILHRMDETAGNRASKP